MFRHQPPDVGRGAVVGEVAVNLRLAGVVLADGEGHQLVEGQGVEAIGRHQHGADRAEAQPPPHEGRGDAEAGPDLLGAPALGLGQVAEGLELVGRMHGEAGDVFVETDLEGVVGGVEQAANGLGLRQPLALGQNAQGQPPSFADGDEIAAGFHAVVVAFGLDHGRLQHALDGDGGGERLHVGRRVRRLARVARRLPEPVEGDEDLLRALGGTGLVDGHGIAPWGWGAGAKPPEPLPVGETRGSKRQGGPRGGGSPGLHGAKRRKTGDTPRAGGAAAHPGARGGRSPLALADRAARTESAPAVHGVAGLARRSRAILKRACPERLSWRPLAVFPHAPRGVGLRS